MMRRRWNRSNAATYSSYPTLTEKLKQLRLENERKKARLDADKLGDPDVEKVTVVASVPGAAVLAALDGLEGDPSSEDGADQEP